jgi:hypothetical protein
MERDEDRALVPLSEPNPIAASRETIYQSVIDSTANLGTEDSGAQSNEQPPSKVTVPHLFHIMPEVRYAANMRPYLLVA